MPVVEESYRLDTVCRRQVKENPHFFSCFLKRNLKSSISSQEYEGTSSSSLSPCVEGVISLILEI